MRLAFFKNIYKFLQKDLSLSLSLGYLALIVIGMIFDVAYYALFRINIIEYADISDFLLAPFRDPFILLFTIVSILALYFLNVADTWLEEKHPKIHKIGYFGHDKEKYQQWFSVKGMTMCIILYIINAAIFYAAMKVTSVKEARESKVQAIFKDNKFETTDTLSYIGKTNSYSFFFIKNKKTTAIVPIGDVLRFEVKRK